MMKEPKNWGKIAGLVAHILVSGLLILTGSQKVLGFTPPEALAKYGLGDQVRLIGAGALVAAFLLLNPRTSLLGILLTSAFWGGAICIHMGHSESYTLPAVMLVFSWAGAYLRNGAAISSYSGMPRRTREVAIGIDRGVIGPRCCANCCGGRNHTRRERGSRLCRQRRG
jgi:hypothetical protein